MHGIHHVFTALWTRIDRFAIHGTLRRVKCRGPLNLGNSLLAEASISALQPPAAVDTVHTTFFTVAQNGSWHLLNNARLVASIRLLLPVDLGEELRENLSCHRVKAAGLPHSY